MSEPKILAIMPAYNEEKRIGGTLDRTINYADQICVVDDGSSDKTRKIAEKYDIKVISHARNRGKGSAIRTGIEYFLSTNNDIAVFIDADGQHDASDIPKFKKYFSLYENADVVVASRFGTGQWQNNMPFLRKLSNLLSRFGIWILYNGLVIEDPQNGFRAYHRKVLEHLQFTTNGYEAETEMLIDAYLKGFNIDRIHIESIYDEEGNESKFSLFFDTWKIPSVMVRLFFERKPFLLRSTKAKLLYRQNQDVID